MGLLYAAYACVPPQAAPRWEEDRRELETRAARADADADAAEAERQAVSTEVTGLRARVAALEGEIASANAAWERRLGAERAAGEG